jgi:hypothetical protein
MTAAAPQAGARPAALRPSPPRVLLIGGLGRSGSTLLDRMLGRLDDVCSVGELVHLWERGLRDDNRCGCGERFRACPFWGRVGELAFGGWDRLDVEEVLRLKAAVDRNRHIPLMVLPALWPPYRARMARYLELLARLYGAVREAGGRPLLVDASKHASHAFLVRRLAGVELRLVHLVRDSRGVAFSWTKRVPRAEVVDGDALMATETPLRLGGRYLAYNLLFHLLAGLGVPTARLRYESLVAAPAGELGRVLDHAGRPVAAGELGFVGDGWVELGPGHALAGNPMRFTSGRVPLRVDEAWRGRLRRRHRLVILAATWPLLARYGYLRGRRGR